jgi:2-alkyl-3-oxoalkanoate reductase
MLPIQRVLVAGASGVVGRPLVEHLLNPADSARGDKPSPANKYEVYAITSSQANAAQFNRPGAHPLVVDVLDRERVFKAVREVRPHVVVDCLSRLPRKPLFSSSAMKRAAERDLNVRLVGGGNLLEAAIEAGVKRLVPVKRGGEL